MPEIMKPILTSSKAVRRYENNPVLCKDDIPYAADLIFNAGVEKYKDGYVMVFRNDYGYVEGKGFAGTNLGLAKSRDGIKWDVCKEPFFCVEDLGDPEIKRFYDPRLTVIEGNMYVCFAVDTKHGVRGGIGRIKGDFEGLEILSLSAPDNRNMVLFPEKIGGMYVRLERPFPVYSRGKDRFDLWLSKSPDLVYWGETELVLGVEDVPYANDKIGPAAPPVKTGKGWLTLFHAVDKDSTRGNNGWEETWKKRYSAGIMLLDLEDPSKVIGMSKLPLIAPETHYEVMEGFRTSVIFPGAMLKEDDGSVKIYYGAADTVECLAFSSVDELVALCTESR